MDYRTLPCITLVVAVSLIACDNDPDLDAGPGDAGMDAGDTDAQTPCARNSDCSDGLYCNGFETCAPGEAGSDADGCLAGDPPCTEDLCDEESNSCEAPDCTDPDVDGDGHDAISCGGDDCDDDDGDRYPGNAEDCDTHDEDCDGTTLGGTDVDTDGFVDAACANPEYGTSGDDCDDGNININPGAAEVCDGIDNDCDSTTDVSTASLCPGGACIAGRCDLDAWDRNFGSTDVESVSGVAVDSAGNVIVVGEFNGELDFGGGPEPSPGSSSTNSDAFIASYGPDETFRWVETLTDSGDNELRAVDTDDAGRIYVAGRGANFGAGRVSGFLASYDVDGTYLWSIDLPVGAFGDVAVRGGPAAGDVRIAALVSSSVAFDLGSGERAAGTYVISLDGNGAERWGSPPATSDISLRAVALDGAGTGVIVAGGCEGEFSFASQDLDCDEDGVFVATLDDTGTFTDANGFPGRGLVRVSDVSGGSGGVFVSGQVSGLNSRVVFEAGSPLMGGTTEPRSFALSLDSGLAYQWDVFFSARLEALSVSSSGNLIGVGSFTTSGFDAGCGERPFSDGHEMFLAEWNGGTGSCIDDDVFRSTGTGATIRATSVSIGVADSVAVGGNFRGSVDLGDGALLSAGTSGDRSQDGFVLRYGL